MHATPEQLLQCPGFGNLKVRRIKDAVDRPFKPGFDSKANEAALPSLLAAPVGSTAQVQAKPPPAREPSPDWPEWDIDLDLNDPEDETGNGS